MANNDHITDKSASNDPDAKSPTTAPTIAPAINDPDQQKQKIKNIPTMIEAVIEVPENADADLLNIPILTTRVEQDTHDQGGKQSPQSGQQQDQ